MGRKKDGGKVTELCLDKKRNWRQNWEWELDDKG